MAGERSLRGKVAVVGIGESTYYRYGQSPYSEFELLLQAILTACQDAGVSPGRSTATAVQQRPGPADPHPHRAGLRRHPPLEHAVGLGRRRGGRCHRQRGGGHRGGIADCVVAFRGLAQGQFGRFGAGRRRARPLSGTAPSPSPTA